MSSECIQTTRKDVIRIPYFSSYHPLGDLIVLKVSKPLKQAIYSTASTVGLLFFVCLFIVVVVLAISN